MLSPGRSGCDPVTKEQWERARELDFRLWLNSPVYTRMPVREKTQYYSDAVACGREQARRHPLNLSQLIPDMFTLGIQSIVPFTEKERNVLTDRAYYEPRTRSVHWNDRFSTALTAARKGHFSSEEIDQAILLHETFHHIEETLTQPTDQMLSQKHQRFFAPVFREFAAFAYINELWGKGPCQEIDMLWLNVNRKQIKDFE